jgi:hypothetical protein
MKRLILYHCVAYTLYGTFQASGSLFALQLKIAKSNKLNDRFAVEAIQDFNSIRNWNRADGREIYYSYASYLGYCDTSVISIYSMEGAYRFLGNEGWKDKYPVLLAHDPSSTFSMKLRTGLRLQPYELFRPGFSLALWQAAGYDRKEFNPNRGYTMVVIKSDTSLLVGGEHLQDHIPKSWFKKWVHPNYAYIFKK